MVRHAAANVVAYAKCTHRKLPLACTAIAWGRCASAVAMLLLALVSGVANATAGESPVPIAPGWFLKKVDEEALAKATTSARAKIAEASNALVAEKQTEAAIALDRTLDLLDEAQKQLPTNAVQARLRIAKARLATEGPGEALTELAPIYGAIEKLASLIPADEAERYLQQAGGALTKGDIAAANNALDAASSVLVFPALERPLASARTLVQAAKLELGLGDPGGVAATLRDAGKALTYLEKALDNPLLQAREALGNAVQTYAVGDQENAMLDLDRAEDRLKQAAQTETAPSVNDEVRHLLVALRAVKQKLFAGQVDRRALEHLWAQARALTELHAEHAAAGWGRSRDMDVILFDLIEAKNHLQDARAARFLGGDQSEAQRELEKGAAALRRPLAELGGESKLEAKTVAVKFASLREALVYPLVDNPNERAKEQQQYDLAIAELRRIIAANR